MANPLLDTDTVLEEDKDLVGVEHLPRGNITPDFQLNSNAELSRRGDRIIYESALGPVRMDGLVKTHRASGLDKPADGQITVIEPSLIFDGESVTISDGTTSKTFEFDKNASVGAGNVAVDISASVTIEDVTTALRTAINGAGLNLNSEFSKTKPPYLGSGVVGGTLDIFNTDTSITNSTNRDAQNVAITDTVTNENFTHRGMEGAKLTRSVGNVNCVKKANLIDGETLIVPSLGGNPVEIYEFDNDATVGAGNVAINIATAVSESDVADAIVTAVNTTGPSLSVDARKVITNAEGLITALLPSELADGQTFTIKDGVKTKTFEFDDDGSVTAGNRAVFINALTTMQEVRTAMLTAIAAAVSATEINVSAFNRGFGSEIYVKSLENTSDANTGEIAHTVSSLRFRTEPMDGYLVQVELTAKVGGTAYNGDLTHSVANADFSVSGMVGGVGSGWDITSGTVAMVGRKLLLSSIPRLPEVAAEPSWLVIRVVDKTLTLLTDPDRIKIDVPGTGGPKDYGNKIVQTVSMLVKAASATPYILSGNEIAVYEERIAEFDAVLGTSIVADSELPVRVTRFGYFLEPSPVTSRVAKIGDTMSGLLAITVLGGAGLTVTSVPAAYAAATADGAQHGYSGESAVSGGAGLVGEGTANSANGVKGFGFAAARPGGGVGGVFEGCPAATFEPNHSDYEHLRCIPSSDCGSLPATAPDGLLAVPATGTFAERWHTREGGAWKLLRPATLAEIDNVQTGTPADRSILEYDTGGTAWQRRLSKQGVCVESELGDAEVTLTAATEAGITVNTNVGEKTNVFSGTGVGATVQATWLVKPPATFKGLQAVAKAFVQAHMKSSDGLANFHFEILDCTQTADINVAPAAVGSSGAWTAKSVNDNQLSGAYPNTTGYRGNFVVILIVTDFNGQTIEIGSLRSYFRDTDPLGTLSYDP